MTTFKFPPSLLSDSIAIVGRIGSGKTYAAKGLVEGLLTDKRRVCILDPTGIWFGLRSSADGKRPGFPVVVFGGPHADVPIAEHSGVALAKIIASKNLPAIIDLSEMLIGQRHRFVTDFAETLYTENRSPLHLVIDEADEFCPQNPMPETKRMLHHIDRLVRRGRTRGFRVMLITQRPAVLHKNVLTQANTLIAMRLTAPQDRKAINAWVEGQADADQAKAVLGSLAKLQRGEGWIWAPGMDMLERGRFPTIKTFDSSRTPEDDQVIAEPTRLADVDIEEIRALFASVEAEATSLVDLRKELAKLRGELTKTQNACPKNAVGVEESEVRRRIEEAVKFASTALATPTVSKALVTAVEKIAAGLAAVQAELVGSVAQPRTKVIAPAIISPTVSRESSPMSTPAPRQGGLSAAEQRVLDAIAWWAAAGVAQPSRHQVAFVAGYTVNGHFNNVAGKLRGSGFIDYPGGGALCLTDAGKPLSNSPGSRPTRDELVTRVYTILKSEPHRRVFGALVAAGRALTRAELAERCNYTENGHFNNIVGALNGIGVTEYPVKGSVGLTKIFGDLS